MKSKNRKNIEIIEKTIVSRLRNRNKLRIVEIESGLGFRLSEIAIRFGKKVQLIGINSLKGECNRKTLLENARTIKKLTKQDEKNISKIRIIQKNYGKKIPLKNNSADLILYGKSSAEIKDKARFIEEIKRVLDKKGVAIISPFFRLGNEVDKEFRKIFEIFGESGEIEAEDYLTKLGKFKVLKGHQEQYILIEKSSEPLNLQLEATINLNHLNKDWRGVQSVYSLRK